ncbi:hypothetical protein [Arcticibacter svalbardensis]|uniref:hypothetical protein n=1 Tax=Arcticibacter svalbardensis TaxID=1288027 RepID=UPI0009FCCAC3|nr:hypothetical protein [Arcticibacter svalbardensis]
MKKRDSTLFDFTNYQNILGNSKAPLKTFDKHIDKGGFYELIRSDFAVMDYSQRGHPTYKLTLFKVQDLQSRDCLSDAQTKFQIIDCLTLMHLKVLY